VNFPTIKQILLGTGLIALVLIAIILDRFKTSVPLSIPDDPERKYLDLLDK